MFWCVTLPYIFILVIFWIDEPRLLVNPTFLFNTGTHDNSGREIIAKLRYYRSTLKKPSLEIKTKSIAASGKFLKCSLFASSILNSKVLAAWKTNLITARARKKKKDAVPAKARKHYSIWPLFVVLCITFLSPLPSVPYKFGRLTSGLFQELPMLIPTK